ncbi:hypothetical protein [Burkholderia sp. JKS000303]|uniref:hypothetical protein n=1 Tax=Burkholderia sp. JKS000303 TaxID=1938747 RepID=UPI0015CEF94A|nr:hypothetical protein [Burkholderia sp. JKS000303]
MEPFVKGRECEKSLLFVDWRATACENSRNFTDIGFKSRKIVLADVAAYFQ